MAYIISFLVIFAALAVAASVIRAKGQVIMANIAEGQWPDGRVIRSAENAVSTRYLLLKKGTADKEVDVCGATDRPMGVANDEAAQDAEFSVILPSVHDRTLLMVAAGTVNAGETLYTAASGKVTPTPAAGCHVVGTALGDAVADGQVEVDPAGFGDAYAPKRLM